MTSCFESFSLHLKCSLTPLVLNYMLPWFELFCINEIILLHFIKTYAYASIHHTWESLLKKYDSISLKRMLTCLGFVAFITWTCINALCILITSHGGGYITGNGIHSTTICNAITINID